MQITLTSVRRQQLSCTSTFLLPIVAFLLGLATSHASAQTQPAPTTSPPGAAQPQPQRQIEVLAVVNEKEITRQQISHECLRRFGKDILEEIVNIFLITKELERNNLVITEKDVNDAINAEAKKFGLSAERWMESISVSRNLTVDQIKNDYIWRKLALKTLVASSIQVTPEELKEQLEFEFGSKVQVRQIVVDSQKEMEQIIAALQVAPDEFERLAKKYSVDTNSASMGGLLPPIRRNSGFPEFEQTIFSLQPSQISQPIKVAEKYYVFRCERIFPAEDVPEEYRADIEQRLIASLSEQKLGDAAVDLFAKMQETAKIQNVMNNSQLREQYPGIAAIVNGTEIPVRHVAEICIVRFGQEVLKTEINRSLLKESLQQNGMQVTQQDLDEEIRRAAESMRYVDAEGKVNVDAWLNFITDGDPSKVDFYIEDEVWPSVALRKLVEKGITVTDEDMTRGFEANFGPRVEVLAIITDNHQQATRVWSMASSNPTAEFFGKLANQYSIEPASKNNFGQVPPIQRHGGRPELEKEAFNLKPGEISKVIQVGEFWITMFCQGMTEPVVTEFEAVKDEIYRNIHEKKLRLAMYEKFQQLMDDAQIDNYLTGTSQTGKAQVRQAREQNSQPALR